MIKKFLTDSKNKDLLAIVVIIILNILPRLVYILNSSFFINGDEAIFGTMVRDTLNSGHLPLFFYGNNYLLVFFEVLVSSIISYFFGLNIFSLKIAMLLFWLASMVILYYIGKKIFLSRRLALLSVFLVSFTPAWFDWATKASGAYLTALLFSNIVVLLALSKKNIIRIIAINLSLLIIYYAQPLWLVVTVPFVIYYFINELKFKDVVIFFVSSFVLWLTSRLALSAIDFSYVLQNKLGIEQITHNVKNVFSHYSIAYSGSFFDSASLKMNYASILNSQIFIWSLIFVVIYDIYLLFRKKLSKIEAAFLFSVLLYVCLMFFYNDQEFAYRYLLPVFIPSSFLILLGIERLKKIKQKKIIYIFLIIYSVFSLVCGVLFYRYVFTPINNNYTEVERIGYLEEFLKINNIKCVYALDWITSQHINYFIPGISVRHQNIDTRRPQDSAKVDAYQRTNDCALVGLWYQMPSFTHLYPLNDIYVISGRYIVHLKPLRDDLLKLNFELTD